jgi:hypothetical protein
LRDDPGSESFPFRIQGLKDSGSRSTSKNVNILTQKIVFKLSEIWPPGCSSRIRIPDLDFLIIPGQGFKAAPDPGSGSATLSGGPWTDNGGVEVQNGVLEGI